MYIDLIFNLFSKKIQLYKNLLSNYIIYETKRITCVVMILFYIHFYTYLYHFATLRNLIPYFFLTKKFKRKTE